MLKKVMFYLLLLETASKFAGLTVLFSTEFKRLPVPVYAATGFIVLFGLALICWNIFKSVPRKALCLYYFFLGAGVIFNLTFMKLNSRTDLTMIDLLVIGTLVDILLSGLFMVLSMRESRYVRIRVKSDS